jgi:dihydrodipicolinate synthase/N-acetylneuraminate lyase
MPHRFAGLIPATSTPLTPELAVDLSAIPALVEQLLADGVCGSGCGRCRGR